MDIEFDELGAPGSTGGTLRGPITKSMSSG